VLPLKESYVYPSLVLERESWSEVFEEPKHASNDGNDIGVLMLMCLSSMESKPAIDSKPAIASKSIDKSIPIDNPLPVPLQSAIQCIIVMMEPAIDDDGGSCR